ncbi:MAG: hypothetical protein D4R64_09965 [Porphyromonadaceae bacterium]|nr:MAG: hypothetical protein D4R64_09965 [Porphyromonadaceae bacterium]
MQEGLGATGDHAVLKKIMVPRSDVSERRQCVPLGLNRSNLHYKPVGKKLENLEIMQVMDKEFLEHPTKGVEGMVDFLCLLGFTVGPKRVRRLLRKMRVMSIYPLRNLSKLDFNGSRNI